MKLNAEPAVAVVLLALVNDGAWPTTMVKGWVAFGLTPLLALMVRLVVPVTVPVPESRAVPLPLSVNDSPAGRLPVSVMAGVGEPVVVTAAAPAWLTVKKALLPLVMAGAAAALTVMVSASVACCRRRWWPSGSPGRSRPSRWPRCRRWWPVPLPLSENDSPVGSVPLSVTVAAGYPVVVTV